MKVQVSENNSINSSVNMILIYSCLMTKGSLDSHLAGCSLRCHKELDMTNR